MKLVIIALAILFSFDLSFAQWSTVGGNSMHNGQSNLFSIISPTGMGLSQSALFGSQIYAGSDRFVLMRFQTLQVSPIVCHSSSTGAELWSIDFPGNNSRSLPIGFRDNQIYAINFQESGNDTIYALDPSNGSVIWRSNGMYPIAGILIGATYTSNGDLIMPEAGGKVMRINKTTGQKMWSTSVITPNTGAQGYAIKDSIIYGWTGSIVTPKQLYAMSAATGQIKYYSPALPGDGDQEFSISMAPDGTIYALRDGGLFYALTDNGSAITIKWSQALTPATTSTSTQFGIAPNGSVYVPYKKGIAKLDPVTGAIVDSADNLVSTSSISPRITFTAGGSNLFVSNGGFNDGALYYMNSNLDTLWSRPITSINNSGPAVLSNSLIAVAGNGTTMQIYNAFVGINNQNTEPGRYTLSQNYPNPFNPSTSISFTLPRSEFVSLKIYNASGKEVKTLINGSMSSGDHTQTFDASSFSSGVYFYTIRTENFTDTKKMLLLK